jgi:hypothetical protein
VSTGEEVEEKRGRTIRTVVKVLFWSEATLDQSQRVEDRPE